MIKYILIILLFAQTSQASFKEFCRRFFVDWDISEYDEASLDWLERNYLNEAVVCYWSNKKSRHLYILGKQIRSRENLNEATQMMLENYERFEAK